MFERQRNNKIQTRTKKMSSKEMQIGINRDDYWALCFG